MEKKKKLSQEQIDDAKRLKSLYEAKKRELGVTQQTIADALDITQGAVGHYLNGRNALNVAVASAFANALKASIAEFSPSLAKDAAQYAGSIEKNFTYAGRHKESPKYPVISSIQAGAWAEAIEPYTLHEISTWLESDAHIQGKAFWLLVEGDSMTAPTGVSVPQGSYVLFDTGREAVNGSLVVAKMSDVNEATFKKLVIEGGHRYLKGLNPNWPIVPINGNCKIIGVAVESKMRFV
ncbi:peptidase S24 [Lonsdalea britannica]|uniref:Peptidase S24 n=1 Tax=Lonsdalea britannica TaxID=1082704 RepID=A0AAD0SIG4_9GAMM|nr:S24 family peptidase [Lonsdalea britannica]AXW87791.1 peptidase S24 [Lonsdalea britannica]OSM95916.1 peptidase S24 [Lonsdalea britannica]